MVGINGLEPISCGYEPHILAVKLYPIKYLGYNMVVTLGATFHERAVDFMSI